MRASGWGVCATLALVVGAASGREPDTLRVPEDYGELRRALAAAQPGDVVQLAAGRFAIEPIHLNRAITVRGAGPGRTILAGAPAQGSLVYVGAAATLEGLTLEASPTAAEDMLALVTLAHRRGTVTLRDLVLERAPTVGLMIFAGAVALERVEVRAPGGNGVEVRRLQGDGGVYVPWPRPTLRGLVVRDAGGAGVLLADGAGGLLERPLVTGSRGGADVLISDALTCARVVAGDAPLRVSYTDGAEPAHAGLEARSLAEEAAERASCAESEAGEAEQEQARERAHDEVARLTRAAREGLQASEVGPWRAALTAFAEGVAAGWAQPGLAQEALYRAVNEEVASGARRHGSQALVEWLLEAPAPPAAVHTQAWFLGGLTSEERSAFTRAWLERRRARFDPLLAPLRGREQPDPDLQQATRELADAIAAVHSALHPLEGPRAPEAAASRDALSEVVEAFVARNGGAPATWALLEQVEAGPGGAPAGRVARTYLSRERANELRAWERAHPQRAAREHQVWQGRLDRRQQRLEQDLLAAGEDAERVASAYRACLLDMCADAKDAATKGRPLVATRALAQRLHRERGVELYAAVYRELPEQLGPQLARDQVLLAFLDPAGQLAVLRAAWPNEPWRVGERLPALQVPRHHQTIQAAIEAAEPGQLIQVAGGSYRERLRLRPYTRLLGGEGARVVHTYETAVLIQDCPGVSMVGFTIEPDQSREPRPAPALGPVDAALVRVERSEVELGLRVHQAGSHWGISLLDSTGVLRQGRIATGDFGGLRVDGPRSDVRLERMEVFAAAGELLAVTSGAAVELVDCELQARRREVGVLVAGAGSRIVLGPEHVPLLHFEDGATPTPEQVRAQAEHEAARQEARQATLQTWRDAVVQVSAETEANVRRNRVGLHIQELQRKAGYPGYDVIKLETGKALAAPLARCLEALGRSPGRDPRDVIEVNRSIEAEARAFHQRFGVVPYAALLDAYQPPEQGRERRAIDADHQRLRDVLTPDERDYVAVRGRWLVRADKRARAGQSEVKGQEELEPWPTRWERQRIGAAPVSALFPGEAQPTPEGPNPRGIQERRHLHAGTFFSVIGEGRPLVPADKPVADGHLANLLSETLEVGWPGATENGEPVLERNLPEPYLRCGWRASRVPPKEGKAVWVHVISAWAQLRDRTGAVWQFQLILVTQGGTFADAELRTRFLHSLRMER